MVRLATRAHVHRLLGRRLKIARQVRRRQKLRVELRRLKTDEVRQRAHNAPVRVARLGRGVPQLLGVHHERPLFGDHERALDCAERIEVGQVLHPRLERAVLVLYAVRAAQQLGPHLRPEALADQREGVQRRLLAARLLEQMLHERRGDCRIVQHVLRRQRWHSPVLVPNAGKLCALRRTPPRAIGLARGILHPSPHVAVAWGPPVALLALGPPSDHLEVARRAAKRRRVFAQPRGAEHRQVGGAMRVRLRRRLRRERAEHPRVGMYGRRKLSLPATHRRRLLRRRAPARLRLRGHRRASL